MRRFISCALLVLLAASFVACNSNGEDEGVPEPITTSAMASSSSGEEYSVTEEITQNALPVYVPGSIKLDEISGDFSFTPTKRRIYYQIPGPVIELVPEGTIDELFEKNKDIYTESQEMALVALIKHCNISREDFERAIEKVIEGYISSGFDMTVEDFEIPNADIIYTFDNDIINEYYRRA